MISRRDIVCTSLIATRHVYLIQTVHQFFSLTSIRKHQAPSFTNWLKVKIIPSAHNHPHGVQIPKSRREQSRRHSVLIGGVQVLLRGASQNVQVTILRCSMEFVVHCFDVNDYITNGRPAIDGRFLSLLSLFAAVCHVPCCNHRMGLSAIWTVSTNPHAYSWLHVNSLISSGTSNTCSIYFNLW